MGDLTRFCLYYIDLSNHFSECNFGITDVDYVGFALELTLQKTLALAKKKREREITNVGHDGFALEVNL